MQQPKASQSVAAAAAKAFPSPVSPAQSTSPVQPGDAPSVQSTIPYIRMIRNLEAVRKFAAANDGPDGKFDSMQLEKMCFQMYCTELLEDQKEPAADIELHDIVGLRLYLIEKFAVPQAVIDRLFPAPPQEFMYWVATHFPGAVRFMSRNLSVIKHAVRSNPTVVAGFDKSFPAELLHEINTHVYSINPVYANLAFVPNEEIADIIREGRFVCVTRNAAAIARVLSIITVENEVRDRLAAKERVVARQLTENEVRVVAKEEEAATARRETADLAARLASAEEQVRQLSLRNAEIAKLLGK